MTVKLPIGIDDFQELMKGGYWYADKSGLISGIVGPEPKTTVLPRPRRFGKTLAMSMLKYWFEPTDEDRCWMFEALDVWGAGEDVRASFGRYPVIMLSFKSARGANWEQCLAKIRLILAKEMKRHVHLRAGLDAVDGAAFDALREGRAEVAVMEEALASLSCWLHAHHGEPVVILIDEYDAPIHASFAGGFYDEAVSFFRDFLGAGYKGNPSLYRGVITGILHVAKEGIFSGLNNTSTFGLLEPRYAQHFGFTEREVTSLFEDLGETERLPAVQSWYNGYLFGEDTTIYNPWSVLNYASRRPKTPRPYWKNTSGNEVLRELIMDNAVLDGGDVEDLLGGGSIWKEISDHVVLRDAYLRPDAAWELLLYSGYLKATKERPLGPRRTERCLMLPNEEVHLAFEDAVKEWTQQTLHGGRPLDALLDAMLTGSAERFERQLAALARDTLSFHDTARRQTEVVFQAFLLGLLVQLAPRYRVRSNREAGYGRADVLVSPREPGGAGVVIELKLVDRELGDDPARALDEALAQIADRQYAAELLAEGCAEVICYGAAVQGKEVWVRRG